MTNANTIANVDADEQERIDESRHDDGEPIDENEEKIFLGLAQYAASKLRHYFAIAQKKYPQEEKFTEGRAIAQDALDLLDDLIDDYSQHDGRAPMNY